MAAVRGVNASNYVAAGRAATNNFINTVGAVFDNSPNYTKIGETKVREEAKTKIEAMKADAVVAEAGIKAERDFRIAQYKLDSANSIVKAQESVRKAGVIAAASENIFDAFKKQREPYMPDYSKYDDLYTSQQAKIDEQRTKINDPNNRFGVPEFVPAPLPTKPPTINSSDSSITTSTTSSLNLLPRQRAGLAEIRRVESDGWGAYNAYNLGGKTEFDPIGSGDSSDGRQFGKPLTNMKIGEIRQLGEQGQIHATGAYQFTHNTGSFKEAVQFAGLSDNDYFTPENQDKMALAFGKKYGWDRWSGLKTDSKARAAAIAGFQ